MIILVIIGVMFNFWRLRKSFKKHAVDIQTSFFQKSIISNAHISHSYKYESESGNVKETNPNPKVETESVLRNINGTALSKTSYLQSYGSEQSDRQLNTHVFQNKKDLWPCEITHSYYTNP